MGGSWGGGVLVAIRSNITSNQLDMGLKDESLFIQLRVGSSKIILVAVYIQPKWTVDTYIKPLRAIESIAEKYSDHQIIICGDFNLPNIVWANEPLSARPTAYVPPVMRSALLSSSSLAPF